MSFALIDMEQHDLVADPVFSEVRVTAGPGGEVQRLYVPIAAWNAVPPADRRRIHTQVIAGGVEAWCENGCIVFHLARLPLYGAARRWHANRVAFLLHRVPT